MRRLVALTGVIALVLGSFLTSGSAGASEVTAEPSSLAASELHCTIEALPVGQTTRSAAQGEECFKSFGLMLQSLGVETAPADLSLAEVSEDGAKSELIARASNVLAVHCTQSFCNGGSSLTVTGSSGDQISQFSSTWNNKFRGVIHRNALRIVNAIGNNLNCYCQTTIASASGQYRGYNSIANLDVSSARYFSS